MQTEELRRQLFDTFLDPIILAIGSETSPRTCGLWGGVASLMAAADWLVEHDVTISQLAHLVAGPEACGPVCRPTGPGAPEYQDGIPQELLALTLGVLGRHEEAAAVRMLKEDPEVLVDSYCNDPDVMQLMRNTIDLASITGQASTPTLDHPVVQKALQTSRRVVDRDLRRRILGLPLFAGVLFQRQRHFALLELKRPLTGVDVLPGLAASGFDPELAIDFQLDRPAKMSLVARQTVPAALLLREPKHTEEAWERHISPLLAVLKSAQP